MKTTKTRQRVEKFSVGELAAFDENVALFDSGSDSIFLILSLNNEYPVHENVYMILRENGKIDSVNAFYFKKVKL